VLAALAAAVLAVPAAAQQRPLLTEDPESVGAGRVLIEGGVEAAYKQKYPVSGLQGNLIKIPTLGVSIGLSPIAEMQIDGGFFNRLAIRDRDPGAPLAHLVDVAGTSTRDVEDMLVGMKLRLAPEGVRRPSIGFRFATKLPNADTEHGLGPDTVDFFASVLAAKTYESLRIVGNIGLGILTDATDGTRQNDVLTYGVSLARALTPRGEFVGEVNGRVSTRAGEPFPGTETRGQMRFGARYTRNPVRLDAGLYVGLTPDDPKVGLTLGATYVFNAFTLP
jgi:hypothetical protein